MPLSPGNNIPIAYSPAASVGSCALNDSGSPAPMPAHQPMVEQSQGSQLTTLQPASSQNSSRLFSLLRIFDFMKIIFNQWKDSFILLASDILNY